MIVWSYIVYKRSVQMRIQWTVISMVSIILTHKHKTGGTVAKGNNFRPWLTYFKVLSVIRKTKSLGLHSGPLCKGFRTSHPQRNVMGQSTEMSPLVSMLLWTILNPLNVLIDLALILILLPTKFYTPMGPSQARRHAEISQPLEIQCL